MKKIFLCCIKNVERISVFPLLISLIFSTTSIFSETKTSTGTGNWNTAGTWDPSGVPANGDDVIIGSGHTVTVDVSTNSLASLTVNGALTIAQNVNVNSGSANLTINGSLSYNSGTSRTISVSGNLSIANEAIFTTNNSTSIVTHFLNLAGNLVNEGTIDCINVDDFINITFNGNANQAISGAGAITNFNRITINNSGVAGNNIINIAALNFTVPSAFITLTDGVLKISTGASITFSSLSLGGAVGLILNHASASLSITSTGFSINGGDFQLLAGTMNVGNGDDQFVISSGNAAMSGGTLNINGSLNMNGGTTTIDGAEINLDPQINPYFCTNNIFNVNGAATLIYTSGKVTIVDPLAFTGYFAVAIYSGSGTKKFIGSTIQLGDGMSSSSGTTQGFYIYSAVALGNLVINNPSGTNRHALLYSDCLISGNLTMTAGELQTNNKNITIAGNWTNNGTFTAGTGTVTFNGSSTQTISTTTVFNNMIINNSTGVNLLSNETVNGTLTFTSGKLLTGNNTLTFGPNGSISGEATGKYLVGKCQTTRAVGIGSFNFGGVQINSGTDNIGDVTMKRFSGIEPPGFGHKLNRYWGISISGSQPLNGRNITFNWVSDDDGSADLSCAVAYKSTNAGIFWANASALEGQNVSSTRIITAPAVTSFSLWTVSDANSPLPIELNFFKVLIEHQSVKLIWETTIEVDNCGFEIERSDNKINWEKVTFVKGYGNSNSPKQYSYTDKGLSLEKYYYRLKQINSDGSFAYSVILEVSINCLVDKFELEQNYPNPFNPTTTIGFGIPASLNPSKGGTFVILKVYDVLGNEVKTLVNKEMEAGYHSINFNASGLSSGVYFYQLRAGSYVDTKKMILLR